MSWYRIAMRIYNGPDRLALREMAERGLTQAQIVDEWERATGIRIGRSTVSVAMQRWDIKPSREQEIYDDLIPWTLAADHQMDPDARMLRCEARIRRGKPLTEDAQKRHESWRRDLDAHKAVVTYDPVRGFRWIARRPEHTDIIDWTK